MVESCVGQCKRWVAHFRCVPQHLCAYACVCVYVCVCVCVCVCVTRARVYVLAYIHYVYLYYHIQSTAYGMFQVCSCLSVNVRYTYTHTHTHRYTIYTFIIISSCRNSNFEKKSPGRYSLEFLGILVNNEKTVPPRSPIFCH